MESSAEATIGCPEVKAETSEDKPLEPLLILEEGDEPSINNREQRQAELSVRNGDENTSDDTVREDTEGSSHDHHNVQQGKIQSEVRAEETNVEDHKGCKNLTKMDERLSGGGQEADEHRDVRSEKISQAETQEPEGTNRNESTRDKPATKVEVKLRPKDRLSPDDAKHTGHRISQDFPDALCELLFTLQEGRRLNDQRCSFQLQHRRRCYSEPSTPRHSQRVMFSSMTSLQKEEFFDLLATSQGRRLDDQRAELQNIPAAPPPPQPKAKQRKSSCKVTEVNRTVPTQTPNEDLYNMIVISQAQGRLEDQRSSAPGPMDDEDFFSLLLKVQGGRMDEQRTEFKPVHL